MSPVWVYADMVCDLFHAGHVEFLRRARSLGDRLVVALVGDADVATCKPAPISFAERLAVVAACRHVDRVLREPAPLFCTRSHLDAIGAAFACHGDDMGEAEIRHWYADLIPAGRVRTVPYTRTPSSREIVERIVRRAGEGTLQAPPAA